MTALQLITRLQTLDENAEVWSIDDGELKNQGYPIEATIYRVDDSNYGPIWISERELTYYNKSKILETRSVVLL